MAFPTIGAFDVNTRGVTTVNTMPNAGQTTMDGSLSVVIASDQSPFGVTLNGTLPAFSTPPVVQPFYSGPAAYTVGASSDARNFGVVSFGVSGIIGTAYALQWDDGSGIWGQAYATLYPASGSPSFNQSSIPIGFTGRVVMQGGWYVRIAIGGAGGVFTVQAGQ